MSVIKQINVYNGSAWQTGQIGADAGNITLSSNIAGSSNLQTALSNVLPVTSLSASRVVLTDTNGKLSTSDGISSTQLGYLSGLDGNIQTQIDTLNSDLALKNADYTDTTLGNFNGNFLLINLNDEKSNYHRRSYFVINSSNKSNFSNIPTVLDSAAASNTIMGYRQVFWRGTQHILVVVTELYPVKGRQHFNFYNITSWEGWTCPMNEKVSKTGDAMSGSLSVNRTGNNNMKFAANTSSTAGQNPSQIFYGNEFGCFDSKGYMLGLLRTIQYTDGKFGLSLRAANKSTPSATASSGVNTLELQVAKDGTKSVAISDPAAWRTALSLSPSATYATMSTSYGITGSSNIRKIPGLNTAIISLSFASTAQIPSGTTIATIPSGFRPSSQFNVPGMFWLTVNVTGTDNAAPYPGVMKIDTDGKVHFDGSNTTRAGYIVGTYTVSS